MVTAAASRLCADGGLPQRTISLPASEGFGYLCRHSKQIHKRRLQTVIIIIFLKILPSNPSHRCKVCIFLFNKWLSGCVCVGVCVRAFVLPLHPRPPPKVRRVLVGRLSIPSVTLAVPSFHASAAPRESPSLGSLSALFNERAPPPECRVKPNQYSGRGGGGGGGVGGRATAAALGQSRR